jgi:uncharacterized small protein (DUF1192 family)
MSDTQRIEADIALLETELEQKKEYDLRAVGIIEAEIARLKNLLVKED